MTIREKQVQLAKYRLKQAEESIEEAACLLSGKGSPRSIVNRAYYAMFYSEQPVGLLTLWAFSTTNDIAVGKASYF